MAVTLGIDLASQPTNTAACQVVWENGTARVDRVISRLDDAALLRLMRGADVVGLDAPFGWPEHFRKTIDTWAEDGRWDSTWSDEAQRRNLRLRATDLWLWERLGKQPLPSVVRESQSRRSARPPSLASSSTVLPWTE